MRVLVADDAPVHLRLLETAIKHWGHEVVTATDGAEAWRLMRSGPAPDLVVVDWKMPHMDGLELIQHIRQDPELASTPALLITVKAASVSADERHSLASGYLVKPWNPKDLHALIQRLAPGK